MKCVVCLVLGLCLLPTAIEAVDLDVSCNPRAIEGATVTCMCTARNAGSSPATVTWPGYSSTSSLVVHDVTRCHDGKVYTCRLEQGGATVLEVNHTMSVEYPPELPPSIISIPKRPILQDGDLLVCTVSGGHPQVSSVAFTCIIPTLADSGDEGTDKVVYSSVKVNVSLATDKDMVCTCSAVWTPDPDMYAHVTQDSFSLQYPAYIKQFGLLDTTTNWTTVEGSNISVSCVGRGHPAPTITLIRDGTDVNSTAHNDSQSDAVVRYPVTSIQCEDMAEFVCSVTNGLALPKEESHWLNVHCPPRLKKGDNTNENFNTPSPLTTKGINRTLVANPVPDVFNVTDHQGNQVPGGMFVGECQRSQTLRYAVTCWVRSATTSSEYDGIYNMTLSNGFGDYVIPFEFTAPDSSWCCSKKQIAIIAGSCAGALVVLVVIIVIAVSCYRRGKR